MYIIAVQMVCYLQIKQIMTTMFCVKTVHLKHNLSYTAIKHKLTKIVIFKSTLTRICMVCF